MISYYLILFALQYCKLACLAVRILRCKLEKGLDQPIIFHEVASSSHPMISCAFLCKVALFPPNKGYLLRRQWEVPSSPLNNIRCLTHWWRNNPDDSESPQPWWQHHLNQQRNANAVSFLNHISLKYIFLGKFNATLFVNNERGEEKRSESPSASITFCPATLIFPPFRPRAIPETLLRQKLRRENFPNFSISIKKNCTCTGQESMESELRLDSHFGANPPFLSPRVGYFAAEGGGVQIDAINYTKWHQYINSKL